MWAVVRPDIDTGVTFDECTSLIRNPDLRARMMGIRQNILQQSADYEMRAAAEEMYLIAHHEAGVGDVAGADLMKNYTLRMARKGVPARAVYDALMILPRNNRCPFCNYGPVETLDHLLPKRLYPSLSVTPANLLGSCDRCNRLKGETAPTGPADGYLHPYFEDANHAVWLSAEVVPSTPAAAIFSVGDPLPLEGNLALRIRNQFEGLRLARLYSDAAADEIADIEDALEEVFQAGGPHAVAAHLGQQCESRRRANLNSWRAALYDALANSAWYCSGGFRTGVRD